jgi:hypothetical protein
MTNRHRLLELALKGLESEQTRIQDEMKAIRAELGNGVPSTAARRGMQVQAFGAKLRRAPNKGKRMTLAQKRKISAAMKRRWAERKAA